MSRRTKIIITLGPRSSDERTIRRLLRSGADVVRLNLSHGSQAEHGDLIRRTRKIEGVLGLRVPIMLDLMGPRYRLGELPTGGRRLRARQRVVLAADPALADIPVGDSDLVQHLRPGERVLVDNGLVELKIESRARNRVTARVVSGGQISSRKGINLPDTDLPFVISSKDADDIRFAAAADVDYLAASYVGRRVDVEAIRELVVRHGGDLPVIAKIERARAVQNLEEIVAAADGIMVARGDLGVEVPLHRVPTVQKKIIDSCRNFGKPAIVATQMLESMIYNPRPTRAEVSDIANSVFDGTDALLLAGETAIGAYPVKAAQTMQQIIEEAETYAAEDLTGVRSRLLLEAGAGGFPDVADAVARAAVFTSQHLNVKHIIAFSRSGFTARLISRYRPQVPVLAVTPDEKVARRIQALWGVRPLVMPARLGTTDQVVAYAEADLLARRLVRPGDRLIVLRGGPVTDRSQTNMVRVHQVGGSTPPGRRRAIAK